MTQVTDPLQVYDGAQTGALFSEDGKHRLRLWRVWDPHQPVMVWCLLNPSVADAFKADLTLTKCIGYAQRHAHGGVVLVNLFTLVSTNPDVLASRLQEANHPDADEHIKWACTAPILSTVVAGWGSKPWAEQRARQVRLYLLSLRLGHVRCLGTTREGQPRHPSRLGYGVPLVEL